MGNGVIDWHAIAQVTMLLKPFNVAVGITSNLAPAFGSSDDTIQGDKQNILKRIRYFLQIDDCQITRQNVW
ncbi:hypothetical protein A10D4_13193 [Idiomarina xiamenensis 10-D-4]|uniref:Uncharacterized protein n=1 Tax=Idiomarina xiamenensis 10-D-4 TaxID=740709 RepID=K2JX87_9GAMM|nr:hypothetical protein A10D4_13193 [Idiomarina xiamenensis 10-D-4]